jgi:hypothetical protein
MLPKKRAALRLTGKCPSTGISGARASFLLDQITAAPHKNELLFA